jgi:hypothetical protein
MGEVNDGGAIHLYDSEFAGAVAGGELTVGAETRVIDQQVDDDAAVVGESEDLVWRSCLVQVGGQYFNADAVRGAQFLAQLRETLVASRSEHEMRASGSKFLS